MSLYDRKTRIKNFSNQEIDGAIEHLKHILSKMRNEGLQMYAPTDYFESHLQELLKERAERIGK